MPIQVAVAAVSLVLFGCLKANKLPVDELSNLVQCNDVAGAEEILYTTSLKDFSPQYVSELALVTIVYDYKEMLQLFLDSRLDPNGQYAVDGEEIPYVALAVKRGRSDIALALIEAGAKLDFRGQNGETLLHYAAESCPVEVVAKLIEQGLEVNTVGNEEKWGGTPLHCAARKGNSSAIPLLLAAGADMYTEYNGSTALDAAIEVTETECVRTLVDSGYAMDHVGAEGCMPLQWACYQGRVEVEDLPLTDPGIAWGKAQESLTKIAEILLAARADVNATDKHGLTALYCAASAGPVSRVAILIDAGADVNAADSDGGTPLLNAVRRFAEQEETVNLLLQAGADPNFGDAFGWRALHWAALQCPLEVTQMLIAAGAEVNAVSADGVTALQLAPSNPDAEVRKALIAAGAHE